MGQALLELCPSLDLCVEVFTCALHCRGSGSPCGAVGDDFVSQREFHPPGAELHSEMDHPAQDATQGLCQ